MSGMCNLRAGDCGFITARNLSCAGCSVVAILVSSRITLWRPDFATFGSWETLQRLSLSFLDSVKSSALSNGSMRRAMFNACFGVIPLGRKEGKALPDRWAPPAVVLRIAGRCRDLEGWNPLFSFCSQSSIITCDDTNSCVGSVKTLGSPRLVVVALRGFGRLRAASNSLEWRFR